MTHEELVLQALSYHRNVGATLAEVRSFLVFREDSKHTQKQDRAVLRRLEDEGHLVTVGKKWFFTRNGYKLTKGPVLDAEWQSVDPWILYAVGYDRGSDEIDMQGIVNRAVLINHDSPTVEQMHGAINRLLAGRLIKKNRHSFSATDKAQDLFAKVEASAKNTVHDQLDCLRRIMDCPCCGMKLKSVRWQFTLDAATFNSMVDDCFKMVR